MTDDDENKSDRKVVPMGKRLRLTGMVAAIADAKQTRGDIEREAESLATEGTDEDRKYLALLALAVALRHAGFAAELFEFATIAAERHKPKPPAA